MVDAGHITDEKKKHTHTTYISSLQCLATRLFVKVRSCEMPLERSTTQFPPKNNLQLRFLSCGGTFDLRLPVLLILDVNLGFDGWDLFEETHFNKYLVWT